MGFLVGSQKEGVRRGGCFSSLIRRKQVDSVHCKPHGHHQLAKELSVPHLIAIGVGSTIGAGIYILVGTVAREHSGPALFISFLIAGIAAALSAFCYAELASRCPSAGSAYHYSYICVGEGVAWLIGWALILEYTIGGSAVARGISPNLALFFGGQDSLPFFLARQHIPGLDVVVDPCAAVLVLVVTGLLCMGIKESTLAQAVVTSINVCAMIFIIIAGSYLGFKTGWAGYELPAGYFPFGVNGMLAVFFAYIGFDSVASTAEEVKNPQRDLPLGIGLALSICCCLYMMVSVVIVGLVPYYAMDPDTPISSAFAAYGMQWAAYLIAAGAVMALCSTLMGSILPQPRILMAMARDGLLPSFFSDVNRRSQVPVKSTLVTGLGSAVLAFFMDVSELAGMVSVVIVGLVPYYAMDPDAPPISSAFAAYGMQWAAYLIAAGAVMALCSTLMGSILPQPRILMAMARDGLLPSFFSDVNRRSQVPVKSTLVTGLGSAVLAFFMDVSELAGMVSVGTLLAFTMVAISVLILRYVPPDEVPFPSSLQEIIDSVSLRYSTGCQNVTKEKSGFYAGTSTESNLPLLGKATAIEYPIIVKLQAQGNSVRNEGRRKIAGWTITATCVGAFLLAYAASDLSIPRLLHFIVCGIGGALLLIGLIVLTCIEQDDARHNFGHSGGFICPFVPLLPIVCSLVNIYLLINLGAATWTRVSVWLIVGVLVYTFYGRTHSSLRDAVYVPATHADEIYRSSGES